MPKVCEFNWFLKRSRRVEAKVCGSLESAQGCYESLFFSLGCRVVPKVLKILGFRVDYDARRAAARVRRSLLRVFEISWFYACSCRAAA